MTDKIIVFSFTRIGTELNRKLCCALRKRKNGLCFGYSPEKYAGGGVDPLPEDVKMFIGRNWNTICSVGIIYKSDFNSFDIFN